MSSASLISVWRNAVDDHDRLTLDSFPRRALNTPWAHRDEHSTLRSTEANSNEARGSYVRPFDSEAFKREMRSVKCTNHGQSVRESQIELGIRNRVVILRREITRIAGDSDRGSFERGKERETAREFMNNREGENFGLKLKVDEISVCRGNVQD